ncbi:MAG: hypothetical protein AVDCRST_MAG27-2312, partial [uncultured Craurococcus sp.]
DAEPGRTPRGPAARRDRGGVELSRPGRGPALYLHLPAARRAAAQQHHRRAASGGHHRSAAVRRSGIAGPRGLCRHTGCQRAAGFRRRGEDPRRLLSRERPDPAGSDGGCAGARLRSHHSSPGARRRGSRRGGAPAGGSRACRPYRVVRAAASPRSVAGRGRCAQGARPGQARGRARGGADPPTPGLRPQVGAPTASGGAQHGARRVRRSAVARPRPRRGTALRPRPRPAALRGRCGAGGGGAAGPAGQRPRRHAGRRQADHRDLEHPP